MRVYFGGEERHVLPLAEHIERMREEWGPLGAALAWRPPPGCEPALESFLEDPPRRHLILHGRPGLGRSRALVELGLRARDRGWEVWAATRSKLSVPALLNQLPHRHPLLLLLDDADEHEGALAAIDEQLRVNRPQHDWRIGSVLRALDDARSVARLTAEGRRFTDRIRSFELSPLTPMPQGVAVAKAVLELAYPSPKLDYDLEQGAAALYRWAHGEPFWMVWIAGRAARLDASGPNFEGTPAEGVLDEAVRLGRDSDLSGPKIGEVFTWLALVQAIPGDDSAAADSEGDAGLSTFTALAGLEDVEAVRELLRAWQEAGLVRQTPAGIGIAVEPVRVEVLAHRLPRISAAKLRRLFPAASGESPPHLSAFTARAIESIALVEARCKCAAAIQLVDEAIQAQLDRARTAPLHELPQRVEASMGWSTSRPRAFRELLSRILSRLDAAPGDARVHAAGAHCGLVLDVIRRVCAALSRAVHARRADDALRRELLDELYRFCAIEVRLRTTPDERPGATPWFGRLHTAATIDALLTGPSARWRPALRQLALQVLESWLDQLHSDRIRTDRIDEVLAAALAFGTPLTRLSWQVVFTPDGLRCAVETWSYPAESSIGQARQSLIERAWREVGDEEAPERLRGLALLLLAKCTRSGCRAREAKAHLRQASELLDAPAAESVSPRLLLALTALWDGWQVEPGDSLEDYAEDLRELDGLASRCEARALAALRRSREGAVLAAAKTPRGGRATAGPAEPDECAPTLETIAQQMTRSRSPAQVRAHLEALAEQALAPQQWVLGGAARAFGQWPASPSDGLGELAMTHLAHQLGYAAPGAEYAVALAEELLAPARSSRFAGDWSVPVAIVAPTLERLRREPDQAQLTAAMQRLHRAVGEMPHAAGWWASLYRSLTLRGARAPAPSGAELRFFGEQRALGLWEGERRQGLYELLGGFAAHPHLREPALELLESQWPWGDGDLAYGCLRRALARCDDVLRALAQPPDASLRQRALSLYLRLPYWSWADLEFDPALKGFVAPELGIKTRAWLQDVIEQRARWAAEDGTALEARHVVPAESPVEEWLVPEADDAGGVSTEALVRYLTSRYLDFGGASGGVAPLVAALDPEGTHATPLAIAALREAGSACAGGGGGGEAQASFLAWCGFASAYPENSPPWRRVAEVALAADLVRSEPGRESTFRCLVPGRWDGREFDSLLYFSLGSPGARAALPSDELDVAARQEPAPVRFGPYWAFRRQQVEACNEPPAAMSQGGW